MPKVSEAHLQARRNHILEAAARCFSRNGFHGTTINAICDEAELSTGAVYRYFKSKNEIVTAIAELGRQGTSEILENARGAATAPESLADMMSASLDMVHSPDADLSNRLSLLLYGEAVHTPHIRGLVIAALGDLVEPFVAEVKRGQNRGEISNRLDATSVGRVLAALGIGFTILAAVDPQPSTASKQAIAMLLTGAFAEERKTP